MKNFQIHQCEASFTGNDRHVATQFSIGFINFEIKTNEKGRLSIDIDCSFMKKTDEENKRKIEEIKKAISEMTKLSEQEKVATRCYVRHLSNNSNDPKNFDAIFELFKNQCPNVYKHMVGEDKEEEPKVEEKIKTGEICENPNNFIKRIKKNISKYNKK